MCSRFKKETDEAGKVVIVTGCNTGIGKETVRELARRGATVYMACRDMTKCEAAREEIVQDTGNKNIYSRECDLGSFESIRKFVAAFKSEETYLHLLINNAGVMGCPRTLTKDGIEMQLGVNHMGHFLLTNLLLDLLKQSVPSRIVNVSSLAHSYGQINIDDINSEKSYSKFSAYNQSKLANVLFTRELAQRLEGTGVTVNALHPGVIKSELSRHMSVFDFVSKTIFSPFLKNVQEGAQTTLYVALEPELVNVTGKYFSDCKLKDVSTRAKDPEMAKTLWTISEKMTRLHEAN